MPNNQEFEAAFFEEILSHKQDYAEVVKILSVIYTKQCEYEKGLAMDQKLVRLKPESETAHYNLACTLALMGRKGNAVKALRESFKLGFKDIKWLMEDPDMETLHNYPAFTKLVEEFKGNLDLDF